MANPNRLVGLTLDIDRWDTHIHELFVGVQQYARQRSGWQCVIDPFARHTIAARHKHGPKYDGIIARATPQLASQAAKAGVPVVNVWLGSPERTLPRVVPDLAAASRMAAEHLISRGLKQFAYVGFKRFHNSALEFAEFRTAVGRIGAVCTSHFFSHKFVRTPQEWNRMISGLSQWIETWKLPIGVFGTQDTVCRYLIDVCQRRGLRIPEDVAMVGLANEPAICDEPEPSLSSVDVGPARIGFRAAELLERLMSGETPPREPILVEPVEVVVRRSTDVFAVDDQMVARAMQFMVRHGSELFGVADVVAAFPITRRSLERRFRATLGRSIDEEIWRLRLDRAKRLIVGTNSTIGAIAASSGFSNDKHFYKVFRRSVGMTPLAFRRQHAT